MAWRFGQAYGPELRTRVLAALDAGATVREAAVRFAVSPSYCAKVRLRREATGEVEARPQRGGHRPRILAPHEAALRARLDERDDATLAELRTWLLDERGVSVSLGTIWAAIARMGLTLKKSASGRRSRTGRTSPKPASPGPTSRQRSTPPASSSLTKPGPAPAWPAPTAAPLAASG